MSEFKSRAGIALGISLLLSATSVPVVRARNPIAPMPPQARVVSTDSLLNLQRMAEQQRTDAREFRSEVSRVASLLPDPAETTPGRRKRRP